MIKEKDTTSVKYAISELPLDSLKSNDKNSENIIRDIKNSIESFNYTQCLTLMCKSESVAKLQSKLQSINNQSYLIENIGLNVICNVEFVTKLLIPYRLLIYNKTSRLNDNVDFSIDSNHNLHLKLSNDIYRKVGLSNCNKVKKCDGFVVLKISLSDPNYISKSGTPTKLYKRIQEGLSMITPRTVLVSTDPSSVIDLNLLKLLLKKNDNRSSITNYDVEMCCNEVPFDEEEPFLSQFTFDSVFDEITNSSLPSYKVESVDNKRRKAISIQNPKKLHRQLNVFINNRDILTKIYTSLKNCSVKKTSAVKDLIHELTLKNIQSQYFDGLNENPITRLMGLIDSINLKVLRGEIKSSGSTLINYFKFKNGLLSSNFIGNILDILCNLMLSNELNSFILSIYGSNPCTIRQTPTEPEYYSHMLFNRTSGKVTIISIKSQ